MQDIKKASLGKPFCYSLTINVKMLTLKVIKHLRCTVPDSLDPEFHVVP